MCILVHLMFYIKLYQNIQVIQNVIFQLITAGIIMMKVEEYQPNLFLMVLIT